jgi:hypothetical protein
MAVTPTLIITVYYYLDLSSAINQPQQGMQSGGMLIRGTSIGQEGCHNFLFIHLQPNNIIECNNYKTLNESEEASS